MKEATTKELPAAAIVVLKQVIDLELEEGEEFPAEILETIATWDVLVRESFFSALVRRIDPETELTQAKYLEILEHFADDVMAIRIADALVDANMKDLVARPLVEIVRQVGTRGALMEIQRLAFTARAPEVVMEAREALQREADGRGVRIWMIEDDLVPTCGLHELGAVEIDYGSRRFGFQLGVDLEPLLVDLETRDKFGELPRAHLGADPQEIESRQKEWHVLKNHVEDVVPVQVKRLEQALALQYRWGVQHWKEHVMAHPMMSHLVQRALWARYRDSGRFLESFRVTADGTLCDAHDEVFELVEEGFIGLLHSVDLDGETAEVWGEHFADYEIVTLFPQIDRPLFHPPDEQKKETTYSREIVVPMEKARATLFRRGWHIDREGWHSAIQKVYRFHDIIVSIRFDDSNDKFTHNGTSFRRFLGYPQHSFQLRDVAPVVFSEVLYDLELLTRG